MYKLVGADGLGNYAIYDTETNVTEALTGKDLKLCLSVGLSVAGAYLNADEEIEYTEDYFPKMEFEDDDDDYYDEDEEYDDSDLGIDDEEDEEVWDDDDEEYDEEYDNLDDYEDDEDDDLYDDYSDDTIYDEFGNEVDYTAKADESAMSKLFSRFTDEQIAIMQEYYLYISQRIFDLKAGTAKLSVRKSKDLGELRDTGGTWHYAGFIDMGYAGSSVCANPRCRASMSKISVSGCCSAPIITYRDGAEFRTFNGQCSCCGSKCSAVRRKVALREIDRSKQMGVVCGNCGQELEQSSHYCTFNHPVRFMHIAWDVSKTDIEVGLFGQLATEKLENIIDSNNCIKFGLECIADFFDIERDSEAFKALKDVQDTCISDMEHLRTIYESYEDNLSEVTDQFKFSDEMINKIGTVNAKLLVMGGEPIVPERLISSYKKMRENGIVPPKSLLQYVRDGLVHWAWREHKFSDKCKNYPTLQYSIGCIHGAHSNVASSSDCHTVLANNLEQLFGKRTMGVLTQFIRDNMGKNYRLCNGIPTTEKYGFSGVVGYITSMFIYKICGFYEYNTLPNSQPNGSNDEGGTAKNEDGKHRVELTTFHNVIKTCFFKDFEYSIDYLIKLAKIYDILESCVNFTDEYVSHGMKYNYDTELYEEDDYNELNGGVLSKYDEKLPVYIAYVNGYKGWNGYSYRYSKGGLSVYIPDNRGNKGYKDMTLKNMTIDEYLQIVTDAKAFLTDNVEKFKEFSTENLRKAIEHKNSKILSEKAEEDAEKARQEAELEAKRLEREKQQAQEQSKLDSRYNALKQKQETDKLTTDEVVEFLSLSDLSGIKGKDFGIKLIKQWKDRHYSPSPRQLEYILPVYKDLTGIEVKIPEKVKLEDRADIEEAIRWCLNNRQAVGDDRTVSILESIVKWGTISERQMKYAEVALEVYSKNKGV